MFSTFSPQGWQVTPSGASFENTTAIAVPYFYDIHPVTYLGTLGYDYILNHQNFVGQMMSMMVPCSIKLAEDLNSAILNVGYATLSGASACAPNLTWSFDETYVAFNGPTIPHDLNVPPGVYEHCCDKGWENKRTQGWVHIYHL